jgi:hypothetical protein
MSGGMGSMDRTSEFHPILGKELLRMQTIFSGLPETKKNHSNNSANVDAGYLSPWGRESDLSILALAKCQKSQVRGFSMLNYPLSWIF